MKKIIVLFLLGITFYFCSQESDETKGLYKDTGSAEKIEIANPWIRVAPKGANTALFFEIQNNQLIPDTLFAAESDLAKLVEVHETFRAENNMMGMRHVDSVVIGSKERVIFKPRDLHVMLIRLEQDLKLGDSGIITLKFKSAGDVTVKGTVKEMTSQMK